MWFGGGHDVGATASLVGRATSGSRVLGCDWTMIGFGTGDTYSTPDSSLNTTNVTDLVLAFGGNTGGEVLGSPIVANGVLYVDSLDISSSTVSLEAFDAAGNTDCSGGTCQPLWTAPLGSGTAGAIPGVPRPPSPTASSTRARRTVSRPSTPQASPTARGRPRPVPPCGASRWARSGPRRPSWPTG